MTRHRIFASYLLTSFFGLALLVPFVSRAEEPAKKFLDGLRERGYADMALEYLDRMQASPLCPADLKQTMEYERGITLVLAGRLERDPIVQEARLDEAQKTLQEFIKRNPNDPNTDSATDQLGNVLLERARSKEEKANQPKNADQKPQLMEQARKFYDDAHGVFDKRLESIKKELMDPKYKNVDEDKNPELAEKRDTLRGVYVQSQLMSATVLRKKAETYPKSAPQYKEGLLAASKFYEDVYTKYRTRLAGLYARLYQANCFQQIGGADNFKEAITIYEEMLEQPFEAEPLRALRTKVIRMALECWLDAPPEKKDQPKDYMPAISFSADWVKKSRPNEDQDPDWLGLRYWLAKVYKADADARDDKDKLKKPHLKEAVALARHVAKFDNEFKRDAQALLQELDGGSGEVKEIEPQDFAEARSAGRGALEQIQMLKVTVPKLEAQVKKAAGEKQQELEAQLKQARENLAKNQENAVKYFRMALALADEDTSVEDRNIIHYFLCYLYYLEGSYYNAAVTGEFLARHFPASTGARPCAKIAMASFLKLYKANETDDKDFEIQRTVDIADYIVNTWATQSEAQEALNTLIPFMIKLGRLDDAEQYLQQIDADSPHRSDAELKTGQAMWSQYLLGMQARKQAEQPPEEGAPPRTEPVPDQKDLDALKERAAKTLADGIQRMQARENAEVDATLALAALSLAQIYVDTQQPQKSVELIEDEKIGPKTLVEAGAAAADRDAYKVETYKVALRSYIGSLPLVSDAAAGEALMAKAEGVMNSLKKLMGATPAGQRRLIGIYITLATDIQKQIDRATPETRAALISGFEVFLSRVGEATSDVKELFWVAQTFYNLGEASDEGALQLSPQAKEFYQKSISTYNKILKMADTNKELTPDMVMQVEMRLATTKRRLQQFPEALDLYEQLLLANNMMLNVQKEATHTYQLWADATAEADDASKRYDRAILGGRTNEKTGKYTIWGWGKIANMTAPTKTDKYKETFYEARYKLALCRFNKAKRQKTADDRAAQMQLAKNDISLMYRIYPDMGGDTWMPQFDSLLKQIQQAIGEQPTGLAGLGELKDGPALLKSEKKEPQPTESESTESEEVEPVASAST